MVRSHHTHQVRVLKDMELVFSNRCTGKDRGLNVFLPRVWHARSPDVIAVSAELYFQSRPSGSHQVLSAPQAGLLWGRLHPPGLSSSSAAMPVPFPSPAAAVAVCTDYLLLVSG